MKVDILNIKDSSNFEIDRYPDECPFCHKSVHPKLVLGVYRKVEFHSAELEVIFRCPSDECQHIFICYYSERSHYGSQRNFFLVQVMFGNLKALMFGEDIKKISESYCKIYSESFAAEQWGLKDICGGGYRKSLEFLIKDYLIKVKKKNVDTIKNKFLGKCIDEDIDNPRIKDVAKRAAWLGNDETHFFRRWEDKDISNLKDLITLTVNWIESEILTEKYKMDMPDKGQQKEKSND